MDAMRRLTMAALDMGEKPSVISAICKYHMTERMRSVLNDAMDVHGGKGICMGPNNYLGRAYQTVPIAITVEGANILTRSLIIFGQGAIRCHPWVLKEIRAAGANDLAAFDAAFWGHASFTVANAARALWLGLTGGKGIPVPGSPRTARYLQILTRFSSAYALLADMSMFVIGGSLKRKEMLSARLGDILSHLYMMSATVKRFHDDGCPEEDVPLLTWAMYDSSFRLQVAMDGVLANFPSRPIAWLLRRVAFPKGLTLTAPHDKWVSRVARLLIEPGPVRDRLTAGIYLPRREDDVVGRLEFAMEAVIKADPIEAKLRAAQKEGRLPQRTLAGRRDAAVKDGIITPAELEHLARTDRLRRAVIMVDDFPNDLLAKFVRGERPMAARRVYVVDGARTPFLKAKKGLGPFTGSDLAVAAGRPLIARQPFDATAFDEVIVGAAMPSADEANIGRVVSLRLGCGEKVPAWTVMRNCASGMQAIDTACLNIQVGRSSLVLAGGTDAMSHAPAHVRAGDGELAGRLVRGEVPRGTGRDGRALPPGLPRPRDRHPARAHRPGGEDLHGLDGGDRREALRHHARR